jgi:hypothetical protein
MATGVSIHSEIFIIGYRSTQGELARAKVNLKMLKSLEPSSGDVLWLQPDGTEYDDAEVSVLIKVSSVACFNTLVGDVSNGILFDPESWKSKADVAKKLYPSLHGFFVTSLNAGIVQLLPNLYDQGFRPLRPEDLQKEPGFKWTKLWDAFGEFVLGTLVTLADAAIVHADIRPGYDETANLFCKDAEIRMIDLDSLCKLKGWQSKEGSLKNYPRYINTRELAKWVRINKSLAFVYLQVILVAQTWLEQEQKKDVDANWLLKKSGKLPRTGSILDVDRDCIQGVLLEYRAVFDGKDHTLMQHPSATEHGPEASRADSFE